MVSKKKILWHKLFNKKEFHYNLNSNKESIKKGLIQPYNLAKIIYPGLNLKKFIKVTNFIIKKLQIKKNNSLLDFGSGNGAFLLHFQKKLKIKNNISLDISKPLITFQKKILKNTKYFTTNPWNTNFFKRIKSQSCDLSISYSVFQYFYSEEYCEKVISELIRITKKRILIYDIKNSKTKVNFFNTVRNRHGLTVNQFKKKYKQTPYRFFSKEFLKKYISKNHPDKKITFIKLPPEALDSLYGYCLLIE